ncbi:hypothetical protein DV736_g346, partial [Chaetothyriales sp. CBS 134916]
MALATLSRVVTWRNLFILLCLLNLKSLPFSWHLRLFYQFGRHLHRTERSRRAGKVAVKAGETHPIFQFVSIYSRTPLYETDYNLHKSNSTYFIDLDESRTALVAKIYGPAIGKGGEQALEKEGYHGRINVMLGSVHTSFHKEIKPYERYEVRSRVLGWDKKWVVLISFFIRPAKGSGGKEELLASSLSKYVVKKKRFTVSPDRCLRSAGWLPPAPEHGQLESNDGQKAVESIESASTVLVAPARKIATEESESATPQSDNETSEQLIPETAIAAAEVLESLSNAVSSSQERQAEADLTELAGLMQEPEAQEWDWYRIEAERIRGLERARAWLALDTMLKDEHEVGPSDVQAKPDLATAAASSVNAFTWALTLAACVSGLLFGYDTAVISSTLVSIGSDLSSRRLTNLDKGLITSAVSAFALVASPVAGVLADGIGRKRTIIYADVLFVVGALWQALTATVTGMIAGRAVVGLAVGSASLITPLYISELAPSHLRGRLVTVSLLFVTSGQVVAYVIGWAFSAVPAGWRWMVGLGAVPGIVQVALMVSMPETPRFLCKVQKEQEARAVLRKVYAPSSSSSSALPFADCGEEEEDEQVQATIRAIRREIRDEDEAHAALKSSSSEEPSSGLSYNCRIGRLLPTTLRSLLVYPPHLRALTITCSLQGLQQLCGFNCLMYFSATIFALLDFSSPTLTSLTIAITNFAFTVMAFFLIDRLGRRRSLLLTIPVMAVALLLWAIAILVSLLLYVAAYATALGPVPWQQSELYPLSVRSVGSSLATATNWLCNTVVGLTFLPLMAWIGASWTFVGYAVICLAGWALVWAIYPEVGGMRLEEVGELLKHGFGLVLLLFGYAITIAKSY